MDQNREKIIKLIYHYLIKDISSTEEKELEDWIARSEKNRLLFDEILSGNDFVETYKRYHTIHRETAFKKLERRMTTSHKIRHLIWRYAALLILPLVIGMTIWYVEREDMPEKEAKIQVVPGSMKAILSLADGKKLYLTKDSLQVIVTEQKVQIVNTDTGIVYLGDTISNRSIGYHELETPRGGEYHLTLADGTVVYLNAESRLRYPVSFSKKKREVFLTGEAYFEVAKDENCPFHVVVDEVEVKVYGTSFNVNTYQSGVVKTTLVSGKVGIWIKATGKETVLLPNQLAEFRSDKQSLQIQDVYAYKYIAWKFGEFVFDKEPLCEIIERLNMWYDTKVFYEQEDLKQIRFTGIVARFADVTDVLSLIEATTSVRFKMEGNVIIVTK